MGGVLCDGERVLDILPGPVITVTTSKDKYKCKRLVFTAGELLFSQIILWKFTNHAIKGIDFYFILDLFFKYVGVEFNFNSTFYLYKVGK